MGPNVIDLVVHPACKKKLPYPTVVNESGMKTNSIHRIPMAESDAASSDRLVGRVD
jgi:hypothetical protein